MDMDAIPVLGVQTIAQPGRRIKPLGIKPAMDDIVIAPPQPPDQVDWRRLFDGYAAFYKTPMDDAIAGRVWGWLLDAQHPLEALVARSAAGRVVGLAHFRATPRPSRGGMAGFLDDLFVDPAWRGQRVADRLIGAVAAIGRERQWTVMRWRTADDNYRARAVYDRLAERTMWITYEISLGAP
jgi:GNAT superfamily N-acetyltransferase